MKILQNVEDEMDGVKEFVHPDRLFVETLEQELMDLKERLNSYMVNFYTLGGNAEVRGGNDLDDVADEKRQKQNDSYLGPQKPKENEETLKRRTSMNKIRAMLVEHDKIADTSNVSDPMYQEV
ncbi:hypothetical protein RFI_11412 [Reticulomyxa filosa]|uniref:Uncharacterized protein n=1 Tax=Reticulomyxa filosa TaxID=46433 RepID=X6NIA6_RETFI|nr:hypothetical protein RFI_11412 [Reticulomyxa filosa]|eukprot:ETO25726.1 hypothetical protein RFI_11412 [Reticulomyxa filosa]